MGFRGLSKSDGVRRIAGEKDGPPVLVGVGSPLVGQWEKADAWDKGESTTKIAR
jgi:hypothetical protein